MSPARTESLGLWCRGADLRIYRSGHRHRCHNRTIRWRCLLLKRQSHAAARWAEQYRCPPAERMRRWRSEEHTSELQSLMRISYAVFCLKKKNTISRRTHNYIDSKAPKIIHKSSAELLH